MVIAFTAGNFRFTYSTHLGVMCQHLLPLRSSVPAFLNFRMAIAGRLYAPSEAS